MINYEEIIRTWGKCYHLHIEALGTNPEALHQLFTERFYKAMRMRHLRRMRPLYIRMVNIEDNHILFDRIGYRYISDIISPSLNLLAEMCVQAPVEVVASRKMGPYHVMRCFDWPIKTEVIDHRTVRIISKMHPLLVMDNILAEHPSGVEYFRIGLESTIYMAPRIDDNDYFRKDKMPFRYKRFTKYQPITFSKS